jgi:hypothetical protein
LVPAGRGGIKKHPPIPAANGNLTAPIASVEDNQEVSDAAGFAVFARVVSCQHVCFCQTDVGNSLVVVSPHRALPPEVEGLQPGGELGLSEAQMLACLASKIL